MRISQTITDGFQKSKPPNRAVMALLDFSRAYDTVWREDLLASMLDLGIPYPFIAWIRGFLSNRQAKVRLNRALSKCWLFREGLPQGSVLSPLLFLFFINGLRDRLPPESIKSFYADDVALLRAHPDKGSAARALEEDVSTVWRKI